MQVSALTGEDVGELRDLLEERLRALSEREHGAANGTGPDEHRVFRPTWKGLRVEKVENETYEVTGEGIERLALRTDWESPEGIENFQRELEKKGVVAALKKAGAESGHVVRIGEVEFDYQ